MDWAESIFQRGLHASSNKTYFFSFSFFFFILNLEPYQNGLPHLSGAIIWDANVIDILEKSKPSVLSLVGLAHCEAQIRGVSVRRWPWRRHKLPMKEWFYLIRNKIHIKPGRNLGNSCLYRSERLLLTYVDNNIAMCRKIERIVGVTAVTAEKTEVQLTWEWEERRRSVLSLVILSAS